MPIFGSFRSRLYSHQGLNWIEVRVSDPPRWSLCDHMSSCVDHASSCIDHASSCVDHTSSCVDHTNSCVHYTTRMTALRECVLLCESASLCSSIASMHASTSNIGQRPPLTARGQGSPPVTIKPSKSNRHFGLLLES